MPGQTWPPLATVKGMGLPSMEGRTIARPDLPVTAAQLEMWRAPSMEGRTIARPDAGPAEGSNRPVPIASFNGGPDNCPARPSRTARA